MGTAEDYIHAVPDYTLEDLDRLGPGRWLNDNIINYFSYLLNSRQLGLGECHYWISNTYLVAYDPQNNPVAISKGTVQNLRSKMIELASTWKLLIPVC